MLDPRLISTVPLLCLLACTASYPEQLGKPKEIVVTDDLDTLPGSPPSRNPRPRESAAHTGTIPLPNGGLVGHGGSTSLAQRGGYSGIRGFEHFGGRGTRVPTVRQAKPEVVGELDKDLIRRTVRVHINEVRRCYDKQLSRDPNAKGRVAIALEIDRKGKVSATSVQESTMKEPAVGECIAKAAKAWKFPRPKSGTVSVVYPFVLEPG